MKTEVKYTCLDCKHFNPAKTVVDGIKPMCFGVCVPKTKRVPEHCSLHNDRFQDWWKRNKSKKRNEITEVPDCLEVQEHLSILDEAINIADKCVKELNKQ